MAEDEKDERKRLLQSQVQMDQFLENMADSMPVDRLYLLREIADLAIDALVLPDNDKDILKALISFSVASIDNLRSGKTDEQ